MNNCQCKAQYAIIIFKFGNGHYILIFTWANNALKMKMPTVHLSFSMHCLVMPFCAIHFSPINCTNAIFGGWLSTCDHRQLLPWAWAVGVLLYETSVLIPLHYFHRMNWSRVASPARVKALSLPLHLCQVFMDSFCIVAVAAGHSNEYKIHEYFAAFTMTSLYRLVFFQHPQLWLTSSFSGLYCCISSCLCVLVIIQRDTNKPRQYIHEKRLISNQRNVSDPTVLIWWILKQGEQLASKVNLRTNSWDILLCAMFGRILASPFEGDLLQTGINISCGRRVDS